MKIHNELLAIIYKLLLLHLFLTNVNGLPFLYGTSYGSRDHMVEYQTPDDNWNISSVPRSTIPHILTLNSTQSHDLPPRKTEQQLEDEILRRLHEIKVCCRENIAILSIEKYFFVVFFSLKKNYSISCLVFFIILLINI